MFTNTPNCAHCQNSQWYEIKGSTLLHNRIDLRCNLTHCKAKGPCSHFQKEDLRLHLKPGTAILYDGTELRASDVN